MRKGVLACVWTVHSLLSLLLPFQVCLVPNLILRRSSLGRASTPLPRPSLLARFE